MATQTGPLTDCSTLTQDLNLKESRQGFHSRVYTDNWLLITYIWLDNVIVRLLVNY